MIDENLKEYKDFFIKTSALKDENIDKAFKYMIDLIEKMKIAQIQMILQNMKKIYKKIKTE